VRLGIGHSAMSAREHRIKNREEEGKKGGGGKKRRKKEGSQDLRSCLFVRRGLPGSGRVMGVAPAVEAGRRAEKKERRKKRECG